MGKGEKNESDASIFANILQDKSSQSTSDVSAKRKRTKDVLGLDGPNKPLKSKKVEKIKTESNNKEDIETLLLKTEHFSRNSLLIRKTKPQMSLLCRIQM